MTQTDVTLVIPVRSLGELSTLPGNPVVPDRAINIIYDSASEQDLIHWGRFNLIKATRPQAPGLAILQGIQAASSEKVIVLMGDGCDDWDDIPRMAKALDRCDLVNTNRLRQKGFYQGANALKELTTRLAAHLLKAKWGWNIGDPTNNFKGYQKSLFEKIGPLESEGFSLGLEITVKAHCSGMKIGEIDSAWKDDGASYRWVGRIKSYLPYLIGV